MAKKLCLTCGAQWDTDETHAWAESYYFTSASHPRMGDLPFISAADIIALDEDILTCPLDAGSGEEPREPDDSHLPSGLSARRGDSRFTSGDEDHPSKHDVEMQWPPLSGPIDLPD